MFKELRDDFCSKGMELSEIISLVKGRLWLAVVHCKVSIHNSNQKQLNKKLTFRLLYCNLLQNCSDEGYSYRRLSEFPCHVSMWLETCYFYTLQLLGAATGSPYIVFISTSGM